MYKAIFCDLDGTLLNSSSELTPRTISALKKCISEGARVVFATGRPYRLTKDFLSFNKPDELLICRDGLLIYDVAGNLRYEDSRFQIKDIVEITKNYKVDINVFTDRGDYVLIHNFFKRIKTFLLSRGRKVIRSPHSINGKIEKIQLVGGGETFLCQNDFCDVYHLKNGMCELSMKGVNKLSAIQRICEDNGWLLNDVIYFGDDANDVECFKKIPNCVAVENACSEVRSIAKHFTSSNDDDGVARYLESLF